MFLCASETISLCLYVLVFMCPRICRFKCLQPVFVYPMVCMFSGVCTSQFLRTPAFVCSITYALQRLCVSVSVCPSGRLSLSVHPVSLCLNVPGTVFFSVSTSKCLCVSGAVSRCLCPPRICVFQCFCIPVSVNLNVYKSQFLPLPLAVHQCLCQNDCVSQCLYISQCLQTRVSLYSNVWVSPVSVYVLMTVCSSVCVSWYLCRFQYLRSSVSICPTLCNLTICMLHVSTSFSVSVYSGICSPVSVYHNVCLTQCLYGPVLCSRMAVCATACVSLYNCMSQGVSQFLCVSTPLYLSVCVFQCLLVPLFVSQSVCVSQCFCLSLSLCASMPASYRLCVPVLACYCVSLSFLFCVLQSSYPSFLVSQRCVCPSQVLCVPLCIPVSVCTGTCVAVSGPIVSVCHHPCVF